MDTHATASGNGRPVTAARPAVVSTGAVARASRVAIRAGEVTAGVRRRAERVSRTVDQAWRLAAAAAAARAAQPPACGPQCPPLDRHPAVLGALPIELPARTGPGTLAADQAAAGPPAPATTVVLVAAPRAPGRLGSGMAA